MIPTLSCGGGSTVVDPASAVGRGLQAFERALDDLATVDLLEMSTGELASATLAVQRLAERARVVLAGFVAHADRAAVWQGSGSRDAAGWLAGMTGSAYGRAAELLRLADTVAASPAVADRLAAGDLSIDTATCLHRAVIAPPDGTDADDVDRLVERCVGLAPAAARRVVDDWRDEVSSTDPGELERRRHERRAVHIRPPVDGMVLVTAQLPTLDAHRLRKVIASYAGRPSDDDRRTTAQRLADGLMTLVDSAGGAGGASDTVSRGRSRPVLLVTIDVASLAGADDRPGIDEFGARIPAHVVRCLAGRADLQRVVHAAGRRPHRPRQPRAVVHRAPRREAPHRLSGDRRRRRPVDPPTRRGGDAMSTPGGSSPPEVPWRRGCQGAVTRRRWRLRRTGRCTTRSRRRAAREGWRGPPARRSDHRP